MTAVAAKIPSAERTLLAAGSYLAEIRLARPCAADLLERGLEQMGWSDVRPDLSSMPRPRPAAIATTRRPAHVRLVAREPAIAPVRGLVFLGRLLKPIAIRNTESFTWALTHRFASWQPYADVSRYTVQCFRLLTGVAYELRFLSRALPGKASRENVTADLQAMGWAPEQLTSVQKNTRIPKRTAADMTLWLAIARWTKAKSYTTGEDPFYFEDCVAISP